MRFPWWMVTALSMAGCEVSAPPKPEPAPPPLATAVPAPPPQGGPEERVCGGAGGECVVHSSCEKGRHLLEPACGTPLLVCCAPEGACEGPEDFRCCAYGSSYRPICTNGKLECPAGHTRCAK